MPLVAVPNHPPQSPLLVGIYLDEFNAEFSVLQPSLHGEIHSQRVLRLDEVDLDPKVLQFRRGVGTVNPAPLEGNVDNRSRPLNRPIAE